MSQLWVHLDEVYLPVILLVAPALVTGLAMALAGSSLGTLVLLRREALLALALPQFVLLGSAVGLRYLTLEHEPESAAARWAVEHAGWPTLPGAVAAVAVALLVATPARGRLGGAGGGAGAAAVVLPSLYIGAIAAAVLVVKNSGSHMVDVQNRFVGVDVAVDRHLAEVSCPILLAAGVTAAVLWRRWVLLAQAPAAAQAAGLRPRRWDALFRTLLSAVVLVGTNALGAVMTTALLFLPAATVLPWARRVPAAIAPAAVLSILTYAGGFVLSTEWDWPLAHSVGGLGLVLFLVSHLASLVRR